MGGQILSQQKEVELTASGGGDFPVTGGMQARAQGDVCGRSFCPRQKTVMISESLGSGF